ncbi:MAG: hypothetical protein SPJ34_07920, partial [Candidatus Ornithospirochaeta sp.]|nr:hypothetical protein [Candidatus Ornithospirochaeta sp.]
MIPLILIEKLWQIAPFYSKLAASGGMHYNIEENWHIYHKYSIGEQAMEIKRDFYLDKLKSRMHNGLIK